MLYIFVILLTFAGKFFLFSVENSWNQLNTDFSYFPLKTKFRKLQNRYRMNLLKEGVDGFSSFLWFSGLFFFCKQNYPSDWFLCFQPFPVKFSNDICIYAVLCGVLWFFSSMYRYVIYRNVSCVILYKIFYFMTIVNWARHLLLTMFSLNQLINNTSWSISFICGDRH